MTIVHDEGCHKYNGSMSCIKNNYATMEGSCDGTAQHLLLVRSMYNGLHKLNGIKIQT